MKPVRFVAVAASLVVAALAAGLTDGDVAARPKPPPVVVAPPPPPPMPAVGLGDRFIHDAAAFEGYMRQAESISPAFASPEGGAQSLKLGVAYEPGEFQRGEVAFAAIAAMQDRAFVDAVRAAGATPEARYQIVSRIYADPGYSLAIPGGSTAAGLAKQALASDGMRLLDDGKSVRRAAYDVQNQPWSRDDVADRDARLAGVKQLSSASRAVAEADAAQLRAEVAGGASDDPPAPASPPFSPLVIRATALAALAAIGQAGDDMADHLGWLAEDYFTQHCLAHAKNELNECLAVAKPNYEDIFCLGEPTMMYTGECVVKGAGATVPLEVVTRQFKVPPVHRAVHRRRRN